MGDELPDAFAFEKYRKVRCHDMGIEPERGKVVSQRHRHDPVAALVHQQKPVGEVEKPGVALVSPCILRGMMPVDGFCQCGRKIPV